MSESSYSLKLSNRNVLWRCHCSSQPLLQVGDQIVYVFNSYRKPYELFGHAHLLTVGGRNHCMRGENGNRDQRFNSPETGCQREQMQAFAHALGIFASAVNFKAENTASAFHLLYR